MKRNTTRCLLFTRPFVFTVSESVETATATVHFAKLKLCGDNVDSKQYLSRRTEAAVSAMGSLGCYNDIALVKTCRNMVHNETFRVICSEIDEGT